MKSRSILKATLAVAIGLLVLSVAALWLRPPELIRVAANYTAKMICSNVFLADRDPQEVLRIDVQAPGHPLLKLMRVRVDRATGVVRTGLLGFIGDGLAQVRRGVGCASIPDGRLDPSAMSHVPAIPVAHVSAGTSADGIGAGPALWPEGDLVQVDSGMMRLIGDDGLTGHGMRAVIVIHDGRIVAERYTEGFDRATPQLGWSMSKTVTAGLIGVLAKQGKLALSSPAGWATGDARHKITLADLMAMSSGLEFNEGYGAVSDVTRMLYLESDMSKFAADKPLVHPIGDVWSYSSGSAVILARAAQDADAMDPATLARRLLFEPLGMASAVMETDESGTFVGSSYLYATPRDWARYGQFLAKGGVWHGNELLPAGYVAMMATPVASSGGEYDRGFAWHWASAPTTADENPAARFGIPDDGFWMSGHDGQYVAIIPSIHLVVVRLGLTPSHEHYMPEALVGAVISSLH